jgi:hypothetical protein
MAANGMDLRMDEIQSLLGAGDSFAAMEQIQRHGEPLDIAARYESLVLELYWKRHDLPALTVVGRAGIIYCLGQSLVTEVGPTTVEKLRHAAKGLAYNIGSFTWPGWEEPGISPTPEDLALGRDCARLNFRLAIELKRPPKGLSKAHWLIGAHALASRDFELAEKEFQSAQDVLPATDEAAKEMEPCNMGYLAVARLCKNKSDASAQARFEEITAQLGAQKGEDSRSYLSQLMTARRLFVPD